MEFPKMNFVFEFSTFFSVKFFCSALTLLADILSQVIGVAPSYGLPLPEGTPWPRAK